MEEKIKTFRFRGLLFHESRIDRTINEFIKENVNELIDIKIKTFGKSTLSTVVYTIIYR